MEDITLRAISTLREVEAIIAEDTRTYRTLAVRHAIPMKPVYSLYKGNESARVDHLMPKLREGSSAALVTESGTPAVSDPGALLVRRCLEDGIPVIPIPGPSALTCLLSVAGVFARRVTFFGFLSKKNSIRRVTETMNSGSAVILYEHPRRLAKTLGALALVLPGARVVVGREMTKRFEELWCGRIEDAAAKFSQAPVRGEVALILEPVKPEKEADEPWPT